MTRTQLSFLVLTPWCVLVESHVRNFLIGPRFLLHVIVSGRFFRFPFIPCDSGFESNCEAGSPLFLTFLVELCIAKSPQPIKKYEIALPAYLLSSTLVAVLQHHVIVFSSSS